MKLKYLKTLLFATFLILAGNALAQAQIISFVIADSKENKITLSGTSTFHDWSMKSSTFTGRALFNLSPGNDIKGLQLLNFTLPVTTLKSNKKALNKNAYKALKSDQFKDIHYKLTTAKVLGVKDFVCQIETTGNLTVAGVTKEVTIDIFCFANKNGSITCTGAYKLKMTDYKVEPPTFLDGLMSTGDEMVLHFSMRFER